MRFFLIQALLFIAVFSGYGKEGLVINYSVSLSQVNRAKNGDIRLDTLQNNQVSLFLLDSTFYVTRGSQRTCYNFQREKIYFLNLSENTYDETSLYAEIDYRQAELLDRVKLRAFLNKKNIENQVGSIFQLESFFGIRIKKAAPPDLKQKNKSHEIDFFMNKEKVSAVNFSEESISGFENMFKKFLLYETQIHPSIIQKIIAEGKIPKDLSFHFFNKGKEYQASYTLKGIKRKANLLELNQGQFLFAYQTKDALITALNKVYAFVNNNTIQFKNREECIQKFNSAFKKKNYTNAFLILMEQNLSNNAQFPQQFKQIESNGEKEKNFREFIAALAPAKDQTALKENIHTLEQLKKKKKITKSYLLDAFLANLYKQINERETALQLFSNVVNHNPYITSLYSDLGNLFIEQHSMRLAWKCYEIALKIAPGHPVSKKIMERKKFLKSNFPEFFL